MIPAALPAGRGVRRLQRGLHHRRQRGRPHVLRPRRRPAPHRLRGLVRHHRHRAPGGPRHPRARHRSPHDRAQPLPLRPMDDIRSAYYLRVMALDRPGTESKASSTSSMSRTTFMPAPAAAEGRLDGDRQAVLFGEGAGLGSGIHRAVAAGHQRGAGADGGLPGRDLVAEQPDGVRASGRSRSARRPGRPGRSRRSRTGSRSRGGRRRPRTRPPRRAAWGCSGRCPRASCRPGVGLVRGGDVQGVGVDVRVHGDGGQLRRRRRPGRCGRRFLHGWRSGPCASVTRFSFGSRVR